MPLPVLAATTDFKSPLFWAAFIAWIMSVVLHEFAHGIVAHFGGDYTIRERGGLTLNPLQYVHPVNSLLLPALLLLMGGIPLPGGATYVRRDLLRSRGWDSAVSLAGPAMNLLLLVACAVPLHPAVGWVDPMADPYDWSPAQRLLATMVVLQGVAVILNLIPIPPLDGFGAISPYMDEQTREKLMTPGASMVGLLALWLVLRSVPALQQGMYGAVDRFLRLIGFDDMSLLFVARSFNMTLFGSPGGT